MSDRPMQIPNLAGWKEERLDRLCLLISRGTAPVYVDDSSVLAIGQRCVREHGFDADAARPHDPRVRHVLKAERGDVLLNSTGTGTIGRSCIFNSDGSFVVDSHITVLRPDRSRVDPAWLDALLRSQWGQRHLESYCFVGSTNQVELSRAELLATKVPVPPLGGQRRIAKSIDTIDSEIKTVQCNVTKLETFRQGLMEDLLSGRVWG